MTNLIRVASMNVKGGMSPLGLRAGGRRGGLGQSQDRITEGLHRANAREIVLAALQEMSGLQAQRIVEGHPHWDLHAATPNVVEDVRGTEVTLGNGLAWRNDIFELERASELVFDMPEDVRSRYKVPDALHFPKVRLLHLETGLRLRVVGIHFMAGRTKSAQAAKRASEALVSDWAFRTISNHPDDAVIVAGDRNRADLLDSWSHVEHGVDYVGSPNRTVTDRLLDEEYRGLVSDHVSISGVVPL